MSKKLTVDFYQVRLSQPSNLSFEEIIQKIANTSSQQRAKEVRLHHPLYIFSIQYGWQDAWEGEIVRLRMNDIPVKGNLSGQIEDFQLTHDEGIGEQSAFIYHPATRILALQSNRHGVSPGDFARYFEMFGGHNASITLDPVVQMSALQKLAKLKDVTKFEVNIARLSNTSIFGNDDCAVEEMVHLAEIFHAPSMYMEFRTSIKRNEPPLFAKQVINAAHTLLRMAQTQQNKISTLKVVGSDDENSNTVIDLLKDKMRESLDVDNYSRNRNIPYSIRQTALQKAWNNRLVEILQMFQ